MKRQCCCSRRREVARRRSPAPDPRTAAGGWKGRDVGSVLPPSLPPSFIPVCGAAVSGSLSGDYICLWPLTWFKILQSRL